MLFLLYTQNPHTFSKKFSGPILKPSCKNGIKKLDHLQSLANFLKTSKQLSDSILNNAELSYTFFREKFS